MLLLLACAGPGPEAPGVATAAPPPAGLEWRDGERGRYAFAWDGAVLVVRPEPEHVVAVRDGVGLSVTAVGPGRYGLAIPPGLGPLQVAAYGPAGLDRATLPLGP